MSDACTDDRAVSDRCADDRASCLPLPLPMPMQIIKLQPPVRHILCTSCHHFPSLFFHQRGSDVCLRSASIGDVLELSYQVRLQGSKGERGLIVDGAQVIAAEGG